ncbi:MAG: hypothetical protein N4A32_01665 [Marinifilaceae bacterium]|jgi:hypothetical protein|nr:hypothetical protein [Marinifilaceae bacterium]
MAINTPNNDMYIKMDINQMKLIKGGTYDETTHVCTCKGKDGKEVRIKVLNEEECWNACA